MTREELELLCSRHFDADLTQAEATALEAALNDDPSLREFFDALQSAHDSMGLLHDAWKLPHDFTSKILDQVEDELSDRDNVITMPTRRFAPFAVAAALLLAVGLIIGVGMATKTSGKPAGGPSTIAKSGTPSTTVKDTDVSDPTPEASGTEVVAFSHGSMTVVDADGKTFTGANLKQSIKFPATVSAPSDQHAVVEFGDATAVLSAGSSARLLEADADGISDIEPVEGDVYLETRDRMRAQLSQTRVELLNGGVTLRRTSDGFVIEPSHGQTDLYRDNTTQTVDPRHAVVIDASGVQFEEREQPRLDDWVVSGRLDAVKRQLRVLIGDDFDKITSQQWEQWDRMMRGMLSNPMNRAMYAMSIRLLLKHGWLEETTAQERTAIESIADILAEGTSETDVPEILREYFRAIDEQLTKNPDTLRDIAKAWKERVEREATENHSD